MGPILSVFDLHLLNFVTYFVQFPTQNFSSLSLITKRLHIIFQKFLCNFIFFLPMSDMWQNVFNLLCSSGGLGVIVAPAITNSTTNTFPNNQQFISVPVVLYTRLCTSSPKSNNSGRYSYSIPSHPMMSPSVSPLHGTSSGCGWRIGLQYSG